MTPNANGARRVAAAPIESPSSSRFGVYQPALPVERRRHATPQEPARIARDARTFFARFG
jgi:hypothetical protein